MSLEHAKLKITLTKSPISQKPALRKTAAALGLKRLHKSVIQEARPEIIGMIRRIEHMVRVEEIKA